MPFPAFLDACVLIPIRLTDLLLRLAEAGTYRALWSDEVLDEVERNLVGHFGLEPVQAKRRLTGMRSAFPDARVTGYRRSRERRCDLDGQSQGFDGFLLDQPELYPAVTLRCLRGFLERFERTVPGFSEESRRLLGER